jgi:hypothetical protein
VLVQKNEKTGERKVLAKDGGASDDGIIKTAVNPQTGKKELVLIDPKTGDYEFMGLDPGQDDLLHKAIVLARDDYRVLMGDISLKKRAKEIASFFQEGVSSQEGPPTSPPDDEPQGDLPPTARDQLKEGQTTRFANGQVWTLENGKPKRVE